MKVIELFAVWERCVSSQLNPTRGLKCQVFGAWFVRAPNVASIWGLYAGALVNRFASSRARYKREKRFVGAHWSLAPTTPLHSPPLRLGVESVRVNDAGFFGLEAVTEVD